MPEMTEEREVLQGKLVTENIYLCPDGVYRWVYEFPMLKNPTILFTVWKVLGVTALICLALEGLPLLIAEGPSSLLGAAKTICIGLAVLLPVSILGYVVLAGLYGWTYMVLFEMDEKEIKHIQMQKQFRKAEAMGWLSAMAGLAAGSLGAAGSGILAASRDTSVSVYASVRHVRANRAMHVIHLKQRLERNQIYAADADYDFVLDYILKRVPASAGGRTYAEP